jgi:ferredoxin
MAIKLNEAVCVGCGCCSDVCMAGALELQVKAVLYQEHCIECKKCIEMCPAGALTA